MQTRHKRKRKLLRTVFFVLGIIAFLWLGIYAGTRFYLEPLLKKKLSAFVEKGSDHLYRCEIGRLDINLWKGAASLRNLEIFIDSSRYREIKNSGHLPPLMFNVSLEEGSISGIRIFRLLFSKKLVLQDIITEGAHVQVYRNYEKKQKTEEKEPLWKRMQPHLRSIQIGRIVLENVRFSYEAADGSRKFLFSYEQGAARLENIMIDSAAYADTSRFLFARNIYADFRHIEMFTRDSLYSIAMEELHYSSGERKTAVKNFRLKPVFSSDYMKKKAGHQVDVYSGNIAYTEIFGFIPQRLALHGEIHADSVRVESPDFHIFHDRNAPMDMTDRVKRFPHVALQNAKMHIHIGLARVSKGLVEYTEKNTGHQQQGTIKFSHLEGTIDHISNIETKKKYCIARFHGTFLDAGPINAVFTLSLEHGNSSYQVTGNLGKMDATRFNRMAVPLGHLEVISGTLQQAHFSMEGSGEQMEGILHVRYINLDLDILKDDKKTGELKEKKFMSFLADELFIRKNNPVNDSNAYDPGLVTLERKTEQSFFNSIWKTILAGIQETMIKGPLRKKEFGKQKRKKDRKEQEKKAKEKKK